MAFLPFLYMLFALQALAATPADWRNRIIYQVLTDRFARTDNSTTAPCEPANNVYCGGSWQGIINQLDYIQDMGFTAVWISPVTLQIPSENAWHGYWQQNLYAINSNFGTEQDLLALSNALHDRGMYLMVDIVVNHFGSTIDESGDWSDYYPFNSESYFHPYCSITQDDYYNHVQEDIEDCWLDPLLPDVNTTRPDVIAVYNSWVNQFVGVYNIDGFRVDTVKHVQQTFWPDFNSAGGVYMVGEVLDSDPDYVCPWSDYIDGLLNYPLYYSLTQAFQSTSGNISSLASMISRLATQCKDTTLMAPFLENHDQPRFPHSTSSMSLIKNAILTTLMSDGPPIIYEGQEWALASPTDPYNREAIWLQSGAYSGTGVLHGYIASINGLRNQLIYATGGYWPTSTNTIIWQDSHSMVMKKGFNGGQSITIVTNQAEGGSEYSVGLASSLTGWTANTTLVETISCRSSNTDRSGGFSLTISGGVPQIWVAVSLIFNSGICNY